MPFDDFDPYQMGMPGAPQRRRQPIGRIPQPPQDFDHEQAMQGLFGQGGWGDMPPPVAAPQQGTPQYFPLAAGMAVNQQPAARTMSYDEFVGRPPVEIPNRPVAPLESGTPAITNQAYGGAGWGPSASPAAAAAVGAPPPAPPPPPATPLTSPTGEANFPGWAGSESPGINRLTGPAGRAASVAGMVGGAMPGMPGMTMPPGMASVPPAAVGGGPQHQMEITNGLQTRTYGFNAPGALTPRGTMQLLSQEMGTGIPANTTVSGNPFTANNMRGIDPSVMAVARGIQTGLDGMPTPEALTQALQIISPSMQGRAALTNAGSTALEAGARYNPGGLAFRQQGMAQQDADTRTATASHMAATIRERNQLMLFLAQSGASPQVTEETLRRFDDANASGMQNQFAVQRNPFTGMPMPGMPGQGGSSAFTSPMTPQHQQQQLLDEQRRSSTQQELAARGSLSPQSYQEIQSSSNPAAAATALYRRLGHAQFMQQQNDIVNNLRSKFGQEAVNAWLNRSGTQMWGDALQRNLFSFFGSQPQTEEAGIAAHLRGGRNIPTPSNMWGQGSQIYPNG